MECTACRKGIHHTCAVDWCACCGWLIERGRVGPVALCVVGPCAFFAEMGSRFCMLHDPAGRAFNVERCVKVERISPVQSRRCQNPADSMGHGYCSDHIPRGLRDVAGKTLMPDAQIAEMVMEEMQDRLAQARKPLLMDLPDRSVVSVGMASGRLPHEYLKLVAFTDEEIDVLRRAVKLVMFGCVKIDPALKSAYTKIGGTND